MNFAVVINIFASRSEVSRNDSVYKVFRLSASSQDDEEKGFGQETTVFIEIRARSQVVRLRRGRADHYKHCRFL